MHSMRGPGPASRRRSSALSRTQVVTNSAGSQAVRAWIEKIQPSLSLHGHIHESRGVQKIRKTTIINPGSEYSEGILKGVVIMLEKGKVKDYIFTNG